MKDIELQVKKAFESWQRAINLFNNATEKSDIEYAVFNMETKKKNYLRLMHTAKELTDETPLNSDFC